MRSLGLFIVAGLALAVVVVLTRDPDEPWAVALLILAVGATAGATATLVQLRRTAGGGRRLSRGRSGSAVRRGAEVAAVVALLLWLRALDGLSVITAAFVVATFVVAELLVSARPHSSR